MVTHHWPPPEEDKANGILPLFDPSGDDVEPTSRVGKLYLRIPKSLNTRSSNRDSPLYVDETSEEEEEVSDEAFGEKSYAPRARVSKRNTRSTRSTARPLSSRTRANRRDERSNSLSTLTVLDGTESEESYERPIKRLTRSKKKVSNRDEDYEDDGTADSSSERQGTAEEDVVRGIRSLPVYGNVRPVVDLPRDASTLR